MKLLPHTTAYIDENTGHGHVFKRPDGSVMRCGGPSLCGECEEITDPVIS